MNRIRLGLIATFLVTFGLSLRAGGQVRTPRDELLRLVPADVALCLTVDDLRGLGGKLSQSHWVQALKDSPLGQLLGDAPQWLQLDDLKKQLKARLHVSWEQLRDDVLGDAVVFAYRPGPAAHPEQDAWLLLVHAREPAVLAKLIDRLNDERTKAGELKAVKDRAYKGYKYVQCETAAGDQFFMLDGPLLAVSGQEAMLRQMLDCRANPLFAPHPTLRQRGEDGDKALASVWINPRGFDEALKAHATQLADKAEGKSLGVFLNYWKALDGISVSLRVDKNPELVIALSANANLLPASAKKVVQDAAFQSDCWKRFPADSIVAVAGRSDFKALTETLDDLSPNDGEEGFTALLQKSLGLPIHKELLQSLAPSLGPDWGYCVMPAPDKTAFPHVFFAARVRMAAIRPAASDALLAAVRTTVAAAAAEYNRKHKDQVELHVLKTQYGDVHYLVNDRRYPKGFQPAFTHRDGYLVAASSPQALEHFKILPADMIAKAPSKIPPIKTATPKKGEALPATVTPLARISFQGLAALVKDRHDAVLDFMSTQRQLDGPAAEARFQLLATTLNLFDRANVVQQTQGERVKWVIRLQMAGE
jgi:hypothetical protein